VKKYIATLPAITFALIALFPSCNKPAETKTSSADTVTAKADTVNMLTADEKSTGWQLLFDGSTLNGWKRYNHDTIGPLWSVKEGAIVCDGKGLTEGTEGIGGSLMTTKQFGNFDLAFEWKVSPGGNSGVLYHVIEKPEYKHDYETGPEYQVLDDAGWTGEALKPAQLAGSNYDMFEAPATKKVMPVGEWNQGRLIYNNGHVEQWLNGEKVVEFDENSADYKKRYKKSKWVEYPGWNKSKVGAISLQDHGAPVYYRRIRIKEM
jgi:hypothetical protein